MDINQFLKQDAEKDLLRFTTAGSVDDGKSTLIGRLLHDSKGIYEDQLLSVKKASSKTINNNSGIDFALLTDGLKAEREQGITIDVAYRYFSTPKRKFIIADVPGHEQYTRNMATGASTANLAVILIDARKGFITQSKRHTFIASLLGIPHLLIAVNKMDLVNYNQHIFDNICRQFSDFAVKLNIQDIHFIPISALKGENVVKAGKKMPWYTGPSVLEYLENVYIISDRNLIDLRFPIQYVLRPNSDFRGYSGQLCSGIIRKNDEILVLPSMKKSRIKSIVSFDGNPDYAFAPQSTTITLKDELDVGRGNMLVHTHNLPRIQKHFEAMLVWMDDSPMDIEQNYIIKHTTQSCQIRVDDIRYKIDVNTLHRKPSRNLKLNEIGRVVFTSKNTLFFDPYTKNRLTGSFILIDMLSNNTVAVGMILDREPTERLPSKIVSDASLKVSKRIAGKSLISPQKRVSRLKQYPVTVWLTGLVSSGKKEVAYALEKKLFDMGAVCVVLDGSSVRSRLNKELDFSAGDRAEHLRRIAEISRIINNSGIISICAFVSPLADIRRQISEIIGKERFLEVFVDAPVEWCMKRDKTGLYQKAQNGELDDFAGITSPYEPPQNPSLILRMPQLSVNEAVNKILKLLRENRIFPIGARSKVQRA